MPNTSSQSHFDIGNSWSIDATPTVANVSTNFYGMVANNCVTMMCIIKISINVHCKSYIKLQSKFTPAMIAITYAKPKAGVYWESSPLMCPLIFILPVPCLSTLHLNLSINSNCKSTGASCNSWSVLIRFCDIPRYWTQSPISRQEHCTPLLAFNQELVQVDKNIVAQLHMTIFLPHNYSFYLTHELSMLQFVGGIWWVTVSSDEMVVVQ